MLSNFLVTAVSEVISFSKTTFLSEHTRQVIFLSLVYVSIASIGIPIVLKLSGDLLDCFLRTSAATAALSPADSRLPLSCRKHLHQHISSGR